MKRKKTINTKLLLQVKEQILKEPRQFLMSSYFANHNTMGEAVPNCGTAACIAGWTIALEWRLNPAEADRKAAAGRVPHCDVARDLLGLTPMQSSDLFFRTNWPDDIKKKWNQCMSMTERARVAAEYIDRFIEENV